MESNSAEKQATPAASMSAVLMSMSIVFGIVLPVLALIVNYVMFGQDDFNMLYVVGAVFFLPRITYLYVTVGSGIVTLLLWMVFFRKNGKRYNGFIGGVLLFNAFFYLAFGIAGVYRLSIIPVWLPPFCAAPILFLCGVRAMRIARTVISKWQVVLTAIAGGFFVVVLSLLIVRQPWGLVKHLPNAQGANLSGMDLSYIYLDGCSGITFEKADLTYTDLRHAYLLNCNFNMHKANLQGADLSNAVLSGVNLTEADLRGANLNKARIYMVDFRGADFRGASLGFHAIGRIDMQNTNLCGADLQEIKNRNGVYYWSGARYSLSTLWPEDFNPVGAGAVLVAEENDTGFN